MRRCFRWMAPAGIHSFFVCPPVSFETALDPSDSYPRRTATPGARPARCLAAGRRGAPKRGGGAGRRALRRRMRLRPRGARAHARSHAAAPAIDGWQLLAGPSQAFAPRGGGQIGPPRRGHAPADAGAPPLRRFQESPWGVKGHETHWGGNRKPPLSPPHDSPRLAKTHAKRLPLQMTSPPVYIGGGAPAAFHP